MARRWSAQWQKVRQAAWRRDRKANARCWLCGGMIDYGVKPSSTDDAWEPDHYLPVAKHPELEYDIANLRPSHRKCNRSRRDDAGMNNLGRPSRQW